MVAETGDHEEVHEEVHEDVDEEVIARVAALDIGKAEVVVCVRVPGRDGSGRRVQEVSTHSTMTRSLLTLADRLRALAVTRVVMEATSDYWKPVFYLLEAQGFEPWLVNAKDVKHLPGRPKTDKLDAVWLCKVAERQMLRPSFVPPAPVRLLRDLTRYRIDLVNTRTAEKNRVEKLLEDAQIKLSSVASDIFGVSGREMMAALIAGERDPRVLAGSARGTMRRKIPILEQAFVGRFTDHHAFLLRTMLTRIDQVSADIAAVETRIEELIIPFARTVTRLDDVPGLGVNAVHALLAEIGLDMTRFPTPAHLCSWARFAPGVNQSAGKRKGGSTGRQPLPGACPRRSRYRRRPHQHLPRRAVPPHRPPPRQETSHRRGRPLHPGHRLAPAVRPRRRVPRPRCRLLRHPHQPRTQEEHPPAPT
jgi:transposase